MGHFPVHCKLSAIFGVQSIIKTGLKNTRLIVTAKVDVTIVTLTFEGVLLSRGPIYKISYDYLTIMPKLRSTYDGRVIYKTAYNEWKVFHE